MICRKTANTIEYSSLPLNYPHAMYEKSCMAHVCKNSKIVCNLVILRAVRWPSGRRRATRNRVGPKRVSRVRIPLSPPRTRQNRMHRFCGALGCAQRRATVLSVRGAPCILRSAWWFSATPSTASLSLHHEPAPRTRTIRPTRSHRPAARRRRARAAWLPAW
jgi:hypothetical protein